MAPPHTCLIFSEQGKFVAFYQPDTNETTNLNFHRQNFVLISYCLS